MIDMVVGQEVNIKNVTQIGTPSQDEKIYIADSAYARIHMDEFREMRVFVLMGHTECSSGKYTTFVEAAIPIEDIQFIRNTPVWTNKIWSDLFREIKRAYENLIIVGWAMDLKGVAPKVTYEIEAIHREHFGGVHQVLFLADTDRQEEYFYLNKSNHLYPKDGFYIYYSAGKTRIPQPKVEFQVPPETKVSSYYMREAETSYRKNETRPEKKFAPGMEKTEKIYTAPRGQYREMLVAEQSRQKRKTGGNFNAVAVLIAFVLLAGIFTTALHKNPEKAEQLNDFIETISNGVREQKEDGNTITDEDYVIRFSTEDDQKQLETQATEESNQVPAETADTEAAVKSTETEESPSQETSGNVIPVEEVDGGIPGGN